MSAYNDDAVERLAAWLLSEWTEVDPINGAQWPLHAGDDGYRGNRSYVRLQPTDVVEKLRDNARSILGFLESQTKMEIVVDADTDRHEFPCEGGGGNDTIYCTKCGLEWEYARTYGPDKPVCPHAADPKVCQIASDALKQAANQVLAEHQPKRYAPDSDPLLGGGSVYVLRQHLRALRAALT